MNSPIEEIKSKLSLVDLVGAYVRLQKMGSRFKAPCPFHNEKTPSFMVDEERQIWHCFGCNKGGDAFAFLMEIEGIDFREALKVLADRTGVELPKYSRTQDSGVKNRSFEILELATKFYEKQLWDGAGKKASLPYLRDRGLSDEYIGNFRLGFAPDGWRNVLDFLVGRGYAAEEIEKTGLTIRKEEGNTYYDRFRSRIMFPIMDILGRVIGYSARIAPGGDESQAKYINTPETGLYHKSHVLYGIQRAKQPMKQSDFALMVEGNMDVIAAHQAGIGNTVAVSGTALTGEQLSMIKRYTENLKLFFDMDGAGQIAARRSTEIALEKGFTVSIVSILQGKDAADIAKEDPELLRTAVTASVPAPQYFLEKALVAHDKHLPEGKRKIAHEYLNLIRFVSHDIDRAFWIRKLSEALDVEEITLLSVLNKVVGEQSSSSPQSGVFSEKNTSETRSAQSFEKRSDFLRRQVCGVMMLEASVWERLATDTPEALTSFLTQDPLFQILCEKGKQVNFIFDALLTMLSESHLQQEITRLYFEGGKILEGTRFADDEEKKVYIGRIADQYLSELAKELRKEEMIRLERAMKEAQERGDKIESQRLRAQFSALLTS
ncbi:MAG: DNA primase [Candidatus Moranbacteria bacterium]|nr:DNA primase [Candidatus Moranbacteria bacterium]